MSAAGAAPSTERLAMEVDALHAQVVAMGLLIAGWYRAEGLPVPACLPVPTKVRGADFDSPRHLSLVVSR